MKVEREGRGLLIAPFAFALNGEVGAVLQTPVHIASGQARYPHSPMAKGVIMMTTFETAREFVYRNARPLDLARWQYHFEEGSREAVLHALTCYQNADGGFGHALEADSWNPNSAPIQTWAATEILREIGWKDSSHPIIAGTLRYLASGSDFDGHFWLNAVPSNNDYPHAPWWQVADDGAPQHTYNPTACLAGFIVRFAEKGSLLHDLGLRVAQEAIGAYLGHGLLDEMHIAACYVRLLQYGEDAGENRALDLTALKAQLLKQVRSIITQDTAVWETSYICKPSQFFNSRDSIFFSENQAIADYECEYIQRTQLDDGSWPIPWGWGNYPEQWAISKNWWKSGVAISNLLYLKGMAPL